MTEENTTAAVEHDDGKIVCAIDGARCHSIQIHLRDNHPEWSLSRYRETYPEAPVLSKFAEDKIKEHADKKRKATAAPGVAIKKEFEQRPLHEVFGLGRVKAAMNARGEPIMVDCMIDLDDESESLVPDLDPNYVFQIDLVKSVLIAFALNKPAYFWGYHGTGKTTIFEQACARTHRPFFRVQHTINTEEAHILGQWVIKNGNTEYQLGPLPMAMINGWTYCADEYDFAPPSVSSVYQSVLEGKPLVIKDAPHELRVIRPHPNFRFVATGNTNGCGDETGLYQGTQMQNAANYSRFKVVEEVGYMDKDVEITVVSGQSGVAKKDAARLVEFAAEVRRAFIGGQIGSTMSPREIINCAELGLVRGSDWKAGIKTGFTNRLSRVDKQVVEGYAQRLFA